MRPKLTKKQKEILLKELGINKKIWFICEFCGVYKAYKPKCNKCEKE